MTEPDPTTDLALAEVEAVRAIVEALRLLDLATRRRVLCAVAALYGFDDLVLEVLGGFPIRRAQLVSSRQPAGSTWSRRS